MSVNCSKYYMSDMFVIAFYTVYMWLTEVQLEIKIKQVKKIR